MPSEGKLTKDQFGYAMPVDAPLYARPPIRYENAQTISVSYETDPEAALALLPAGLALPEPAIAMMLFIHYPFSTLGPYEETILGIACTWNGEPKFYIPHIVVNNVIPLAAGREIWGYPKKMATIDIEHEEDIIWGKMERPDGNLICSAGIRPETPVQEVEGEGGGSVSLRVIPSPVEAAPPSVAELINVPPLNNTVVESYVGPGWVRFHSDSALDPWHKLPVKQVVGASYRVTHFDLGFGNVLKTY